MIVIGVAGRLGSGKSTIVRAIDSAYREKRFGWPSGVDLVVLDADQLGHETYAPGSPVVDKLIDEFGPSIAEDTPGGKGINRAALGKIVFNDLNKLKHLTDVVWPAIAALARERIAAEWAARPGALERSRLVVLLEAAVLVEAKWYELVDEVWLITTDKEVASKRIMLRNPSWGPEQFEKRWNSQTSLQSIQDQLEKASKHLEIVKNNEEISEGTTPACVSPCLERIHFLTTTNQFL